MDALPITEDTGAEYASQNPGVMHACGHDGHTAIGLTVAKILNAHRDQLAGTIKFCFQPSEEGENGEEIGGAEMMIRDGLLESPKVDMALALHLWNEQPLGWLGIAGGPMMAGGEIFNVKVIGRGGHGAIPDVAVDPIIAATQIVTALQTIVSRNISPLDTAVVSVTTIHSGTAGAIRANCTRNSRGARMSGRDYSQTHHACPDQRYGNQRKSPADISSYPSGC
jgi:amidohydrolase